MENNSIKDLENIVVYSPHYDDAFLSLGGFLSEYSNTKSVSIIIIFGITNYIFGKEVLNSEISLASNIRMKEELENCKLIGAKLVILENNEALLRGYKKGDIFFTKEINLDEKKINEDLIKIEKQVNEIIEKSPHNSLHLFPLAIGNHIDHILVNKIGNNLFNKNKTSIAFYEEQPYVARIGIENITNLGLKPIILHTNIHKKIKSILTYKSQNTINWLGEILKYMLFVEKYIGQFVERIWI